MPSRSDAWWLLLQDCLPVPNITRSSVGICTVRMMVWASVMDLSFLVSFLGQLDGLCPRMFPFRAIAGYLTVFILHSTWIKYNTAAIWVWFCKWSTTELSEVGLKQVQEASLLTINANILQGSIWTNHSKTRQRKKYASISHWSSQSGLNHGLEMPTFQTSPYGLGMLKMPQDHEDRYSCRSTRTTFRSPGSQADRRKDGMMKFRRT